MRQRIARCRIIARAKAKITRCRQAGQAPARQGNPRAANRRAIANGKNLGDIATPDYISHGFQPPQTRAWTIGREALRASQGARQPSFRLKAKIKRGNAGSDPLFSLWCADAKRLEARATFTRDDLAAPVKRHASALQYRQIAQPIPGEIRRVAREAQHIAPSAKPGRGGRFHHGGNTHAAGQ